MGCTFSCLEEQPPATALALLFTPITEFLELLEFLAQELSADTRVSQWLGTGRMLATFFLCHHKEHPQLMALLVLAVRSCPCLLFVNLKCQEYFWVADPGRAGWLFHIPVFLPSLLQFSPEGYF